MCCHVLFVLLRMLRVTWLQMSGYSELGQSWAQGELPQWWLQTVSPVCTICVCVCVLICDCTWVGIRVYMCFVAQGSARVRSDCGGRSVLKKKRKKDASVWSGETVVCHVSTCRLYWEKMTINQHREILVRLYAWFMAGLFYQQPPCSASCPRNQMWMPAESK